MSLSNLDRRSLLAAASWLALCGVAGGTRTAAGQEEPAARIRAFYTDLQDAMKHGAQLGMKGRYDRLRPIIARTFDLAGMMRLAAGPGWSSATPAQQAAMTDAFAHMTTAIYASRFKAYAGERFEVLGTSEQPPADKIVRTRIVAAGGQTHELGYLMKSTTDGWKVADVHLDGISELSLRRGEFGGFLKSGGPEALIAALRKKGDQILGGG